MRIVLVALVLVLFACGSAAAGPERSPALRLLDRAPVTLSGSGFVAREQLRVTATVDGRRLKRAVTTDSTGRFRLRLDGVDATCRELAIAVVGTRGSKAGFTLVPPPGCAEDV
jgi:hypothetical protein